VTGKISKSIQLITPVLSPLLRESSDRKTVEQKITYTFALVMCPGLEPVLPQGGCHTTLPSPVLRWGYSERNGGSGISLKGLYMRSGWLKIKLSRDKEREGAEVRSPLTVLYFKKCQT